MLDFSLNFVRLHGKGVSTFINYYHLFMVKEGKHSNMPLPCSLLSTISVKEKEGKTTGKRESSLSKTRARLKGKRRNLLSSFQNQCQGKRTKKKKFTFKNVYYTSFWTLFMGLCWAFGFLIKNNIITIVGRFFFFFFLSNLFVF